MNGNYPSVYLLGKTSPKLIAPCFRSEKCDKRQCTYMSKYCIFLNRSLEKSDMYRSPRGNVRLTYEADIKKSKSQNQTNVPKIYFGYIHQQYCKTAPYFVKTFIPKKPAYKSFMDVFGLLLKSTRWLSHIISCLYISIIAITSDLPLLAEIVDMHL